MLNFRNLELNFHLSQFQFAFERLNINRKGSTVFSTFPSVDFQFKSLIISVRFKSEYKYEPHTLL